ncbi:hypothetical protein HMPREF0083_01735 [Aneurinibacillus aneurinilyticus ATCC 12856]|jgi:hypothetical protein|uniref:Uncharacterized protein n=1 Tax=Aneurinibacillus aneurinilyticus ATCC 12856 TaxID=649747 RepID=U1YH49_ANEAE|nr:hypothetical protein HMPREF0083_01735 [Aneurinibacillus aneurinilyticus ATCC 12856]
MYEVPQFDKNENENEESRKIFLFVELVDIGLREMFVRRKECTE